MDDNAQMVQPAGQSSPTALLAAQTQSLAELVAIQKAQSAQIEALKQQNERLIGLSQGRERGLSAVKVENINMPFWALVGFLIKLSLASIPAMLILWAIFALIALVLGGVFGGIFGAFGNLFR